MAIVIVKEIVHFFSKNINKYLCRAWLLDKIRDQQICFNDVWYQTTGLESDAALTRGFYERRYSP